MKILIDLTYINSTSISGVAVFALRLLEGFLNCKYEDNILLLVESSESNRMIDNLVSKFNTIKIKSENIKKVPHLRGLLNKGRLDTIIKANKVDIFFSPYIALDCLYTNSVPHIGVFHDAQGYKLGKSYIKQLAHNIITTYILKKLSHIVTISNYAKNDIIKCLPRLNTPVQVIYNSVNSVDTTFELNKRIDCKTPYILNINTLEPYKNLITLVKAFDLLKEKIPHNLFIKAKKLPYWDNIIYPFIEAHDLTTRVILIETRYTDEEMCNLYSNANLFVSPSLMEGFGFTPIEAAMHQIPVVCTNVSALHETTKGLLNYYEPPTDEQALSDVIFEILQQKKDKSKLSHIAKIYEEAYSPNEQASAYIELIETVHTSKQK